MYTASLVYGNDPAAGRQSEQQQSQQSQSYQSESQSLELKSEDQAQGVEISEPSGAERRATQQLSASSQTQATKFGTLERTSEIIGTEVRSQQGEKLGAVKDVMIDLQSGRVPFAVLSSGGVAGVGDRLLAIPPTALSAQGEDAFVLGMSQEQLRNAPTFQRNQWPDRMDQQWSASVYQFYGQQPYWQTGSHQSSSEYRTRSYEQRSEIQEPSGAEFRSEFHGPAVHESSGASVSYESPHVTHYSKTFVGDNNTMDDINKGSGTRGGAEDLQDFDEKANLSKDAISEYHGTYTGTYRSYGTEYGPSYGSATVTEPSAAARGEWQRSGSQYGASTTTTTREQQQYRSDFRDQQSQAAMKSNMSGARLHRASDLIGLNVKNSQGQNLGEIKDVVIDVNSGRVAYIAFEGSGEFAQADKWIAVPASMFSGMEQRQVTLNVTPDRLRNAPTFEEGSWEQATSEAFVSRIYSHYGQQPYWQSSGTFQEPAGTPRDELYKEEHEFKHEKTETEIESQEVQEPSGAEQPQDQQLQDQQLNESGAEQNQLESPEREISDPSGAESSSGTESSIQSEASGAQSSSESSAQLEQSETQAQDQASSPSAGVDVSAQGGQSEAEASAQVGQSQDAAGAAISEQSGAQAESQSSSSDQGLQSGQEAQADAPITEPSGAATEEQSADQSSQVQTGDQSQVQSESQQAQSDISSEAAGAASSADQTGGKLIENVRTELQRDTASGGQNIQVTTEQGKIVLKGTVNSEADKQRIEEKVQTLIIDNQLQVKGGADQAPSQP